MDIERKTGPWRRWGKRSLAAGIAALGLGALTWWLMGLSSAAPTVEKTSIWTGRVQRGNLVVAVRGNGTLVPETIRWITPITEGRVEKVLVRPGQAVKADTVLLELSNTERLQAVVDAQWALKAAEAELESLDVQLHNRLLEYRSTVASVQSEQTQAKVKLEMNESLAASGLVADMDVRFARIRSRELNDRLQMEQEKAKTFEQSLRAQRAVQQARVAQLREQLRLRQEQADALRVRAGLDGVLQELPVEVGQRVASGQNLAKVAQPAPLKAELLVPEAQAKDLRVGLSATVDTRNTVIRGLVSRIDPAVRNGTVKVDVTFPGSLPPDARPDLSVDGTIELARLENVLYVSRPVAALSHQTMGLFRLASDGRSAGRVQVQVGQCSVNAMEVQSGLSVGDEVILSDTSQWSSASRIDLK